jgi:hypothetical protein
MRSALTGLFLLALAIAPAARAQFSSGSTGSDGALNYPTPGTYTFDPQVSNLNPAGDNVFNFTTINIASGVILNMPADVLRNRSVIWLASGAVTIAGTLNLAGANGSAEAGGTGNNPGQGRYPAMPGAGGFPGGVGQYLSSAATNGDGFGAGVVTTTTGGSAVYGYNSNALDPLVGGAGGAGGAVGGGTAGGNGGAGGGAIRIVSTTSISVSGSILAFGGTPTSGVGGYGGGYGSGGAIHLVAPTVTNTGTLNANGVVVPIGVVKVSANTASIGGAVVGQYTLGPLYNPPLPAGVPVVKVVSVNGTNAPSDVTGSALSPDFTIATTSTVTVNISAAYIPIGTVVTLHLNSEQGNDATISCTALAGTLAASTASCAGVTFPQGVTITDIKAIW